MGTDHQGSSYWFRPLCRLSVILLKREQQAAVEPHFKLQCECLLHATPSNPIWMKALIWLILVSAGGWGRRLPAAGEREFQDGDGGARATSTWRMCPRGRPYSWRGRATTLWMSHMVAHQISQWCSSTSLMAAASSQNHCQEVTQYQWQRV